MAILSGMFMDPAQLSANVILANFATLTHMFPMGIGIVTTKMVGNAVGSGQIAIGKKKAATAIAFSFVVQIFILVCFWIYRAEIPRLYTKDPTTL
jgi:Na+-driven multidrug efflux pump